MIESNGCALATVEPEEPTDDTRYSDLRRELHAIVSRQSEDLQRKVEQHCLALSDAIDLSFAKSFPQPPGNRKENFRSGGTASRSPRSLSPRTPFSPRTPMNSLEVGHHGDAQATPSLQEKVEGRTSLRSDLSWAPPDATMSGLVAMAERIRSSYHSNSMLRAGSLLGLGTDQLRAYFDILVGIVIFLNGMVMVVECEWRGWLLGVKLGMNEDDGSWNNAASWFEALQRFFTGVFVIELATRIVMDRLDYFRPIFNIFDAFLVILSVVDVFILQPLDEESALQNLTILRLLRMAKLLRAFRVMRSLKLFQGLRVLVKAIASCLLSLLWSMTLLGIFIVIGALLMVSLLESSIASTANDYEMRKWTWTYYGTSMRAMYTIFEVTLSGCWPNYVRPLLENNSWAYAIFFMVYVAVVIFAVIRVITAIFLKETMDAANNDDDMMVTERARKKQQYLLKLERVFRIADQTGEGRITEKEFKAVVEIPQVKAYLQALELEVHESEALFQLLDDGDGAITYDEFIKGVSRLKGQARSVDVISMQRDNFKVLNQCHRNGELLQKIYDEMLRSAMKAELLKQEQSRRPSTAGLAGIIHSETLADSLGFMQL